MKLRAFVGPGESLEIEARLKEQDGSSAHVIVQNKRLFTKWKIRPTSGIGYHRSLASWEPQSESGDLYQDDIDQIEVFAGVNYQVTNSFALELNLGYKISGDIELAKVGLIKF